MSLFMDNSLKLSYEMLFQNGAHKAEPEQAQTEQPEVFSPEEVEELLQQRDKEWEQKLEEDCAQARQAGTEEGYTKGKAEAEEALEKQLFFIREMMDNMDTEFDRALEELKPHIAGLVFDMTEKVLDIPFEHPELNQRVLHEVTALVEQLDEELHIRVTVSETDFEIIEQAFEENNNTNHFSLRVDENYNPGEYAIETRKESIIKNFKKMVADFKESISFADVEVLELQA